MAEILLAMLLFGGGAAIINEQTKKRNRTKEPFLKDLRDFLKKSKYFNLSDMNKIIEISNEIKIQPSPKITPTPEPDLNSILNSKPKAWCPNESNTTCSLHVRDVNFPSYCIGDIDKEQCLQRIGKYVADENDKKNQLKEYCQRINDVCVEYKNPNFASKQDCTNCDKLIPNCNC
jgi:hypothetical protein